MQKAEMHLNLLSPYGYKRVLIAQTLCFSYGPYKENIIFWYLQLMNFQRSITNSLASIMRRYCSLSLWLTLIKANRSERVSDRSGLISRLKTHFICHAQFEKPFVISAVFLMLWKSHSPSFFGCHAENRSQHCSHTMVRTRLAST